MNRLADLDIFLKKIALKQTHQHLLIIKLKKTEKILLFNIILIYPSLSIETAMIHLKRSCWFWRNWLNIIKEYSKLTIKMKKAV